MNPAFMQTADFSVSAAAYEEMGSGREFSVCSLLSDRSIFVWVCEVFVYYSLGHHKEIIED